MVKVAQEQHSVVTDNAFMFLHLSLENLVTQIQPCDKHCVPLIVALYNTYIFKKSL